MTLPVFPQLRPTYPIHKRPTFASIVAISASGREVRSPQQAYPLWEFEMPLEIMREQSTASQGSEGWHEFTALSELFLAGAGQYGRFLYLDTFNDDWQVSRQYVGTGDGARKDFIAKRRWGRGTTFVDEPIGALREVFSVYLDDVPLYPNTTNFTYSDTLISLVDAPADGVVVRADFTFYFVCRFLEDKHDYQQFMNSFWSMESLKFRSIKP